MEKATNWNRAREFVQEWPLQAPQLKSNRETSGNSLFRTVLRVSACASIFCRPRRRRFWLMPVKSRICTLQLIDCIHILSMSTGDILLHEPEQRPSLIQCDRF